MKSWILSAGALMALVMCSSAIAESLDEKLEAYEMIVQVLPQLEEQLDKINSSIAFAEQKIKSSQSDGMKRLFEEQLENLEDQKESIEPKVANLTSILDELKKDPEVGSLIEGEEAARKMKQELDKATKMLPTID